MKRQSGSNLVAAVHNRFDARAEHGGVSDAGSDADPGLPGERTQAPRGRCIPGLWQVHSFGHVRVVAVVSQPRTEGVGCQCVDVPGRGNDGLDVENDRGRALVAAHAAR